MSWQRESEPPAIATSTSPERTASSAAPRASAPEAQAEESVCTGPVIPRWRATASPGPLTCCEISAERRARRRFRAQELREEPLALEHAARAAAEVDPRAVSLPGSKGAASPAWAERLRRREEGEAVGEATGGASPGTRGQKPAGGSAGLGGQVGAVAGVVEAVEGADAGAAGAQPLPQRASTPQPRPADGADAAHRDTPAAAAASRFMVGFQGSPRGR